MNIGQSDLSIKIIGHFNIGGGLFSYHTEYQLQVCLEGSTWIVYRRFNHFTNLHTMLQSILGEEEAKMVLRPLPDKSPLGSYFSTTGSITASRKAGLQNYIDAAIQLNDEAVRKEILVFADVDGRGFSGIQKEFGANNILKEAFAKAKQGSFDLWSINYVALLKDGRLFILNSMYDESNKATSKWNLRGGEIRVVPKANNNMISITSLKDDRKLVLSLSSASEAAFWIRTISDFSLMSTQQIISNVKEAAAAQREQAKQASKAAAAANQRTETIKAAGTGNTEDDLSSMYGI